MEKYCISAIYDTIGRGGLYLNVNWLVYLENMLSSYKYYPLVLLLDLLIQKTPFWEFDKVSWTLLFFFRVQIKS